MPIAMIEYLEINFIGILVLLAMTIFLIKQKNVLLKDEYNHFLALLTLNNLILFCDICIYLLRGHGSPLFIALNQIACLIYYAAQAWYCFEWVRYVYARLGQRRPTTKAGLFLLACPAIFTTLFICSRSFTKWVYTISPDNVYHRGQYIWIGLCLVLIYLALSIIAVIREWYNPLKIRERDEYLVLLVFPLSLLIANLVQLKFYGYSIVWIIAALGSLTLYIGIQNEGLARDSLTGLYNRSQTNAQIAWELNHLKQRSGYMFFMMIDVELSLSIGIALASQQESCTPDELIAKADHNMYNEKRAKKPFSPKEVQA